MIANGISSEMVTTDHRWPARRLARATLLGTTCTFLAGAFAMASTDGISPDRRKADRILPAVSPPLDAAVQPASFEISIVDDIGGFSGARPERPIPRAPPPIVSSITQPRPLAAPHDPSNPETVEELPVGEPLAGSDLLADVELAPADVQSERPQPVAIAQDESVRIAVIADSAPIAIAPLVRIDVPLPRLADPDTVQLAEIGPTPRRDAMAAVTERTPERRPEPASEPPPALPAATIADRSESAYVPQISDGARAAYIAQLDVDSDRGRMALRVDGEVLGKVDFQVADGRVSVRIGQVLDLFRRRFDQTEFARLRASQAADQFVSLERVRAAGVPLAYDAVYDELVIERTRG